MQTEWLNDISQSSFANTSSQVSFDLPFAKIGSLQK
jgi:hypothetical protein